MNDIAWDKLKLVIFDVDGTLYDQKKLRRKVLAGLLGYYLLRPWKLKDLYILYHFRKERENKAGFCSTDLDNAQYSWCAEKTKSPVHEVKKIVQQWIFDYPVKFLSDCVYPGVAEFLYTIEAMSIHKTVYSDYPAKEKNLAMNLSFELEVSSTDNYINAMKPSVKGLEYIMDVLKIKDRASCLFIGDRYELDGKCAAAANVPFLLIDRNEARSGFYYKLVEQVTHSRI
ncbi:FMN phosphatase YigB (HAD superfamily) [Pedobacter africanus]|uniref:Phosphoglycolate phosphatase/putative hydrolase of the HAD superfamily n=1 Tax=Pedobacter africanus TaxID=151894 RepID=A0ACC6KT90_9SPHI|nr:HAD family hydrolase [Pedobacter africanus]MDR6782479.1 phosphoglycolate phosphatase/putative hydrolase of the HAD superfamily [Pedobacter africanus]